MEFVCKVWENFLNVREKGFLVIFIVFLIVIGVSSSVSGLSIVNYNLFLSVFMF